MSVHLILIWNNLCLLTWEDIYKSIWPPNFLPSSEGEEGGNCTLKVNFVRLHGSINVTTNAGRFYDIPFDTPPGFMDALL